MNQVDLHNTSLSRILLKLPEGMRLIVQTVVIAFVAGLSSVAFLFFTHLLFAQSYQAFAARSQNYFVLASFLMITLSSLLVCLLLRYFGSEAAGSGIPQVKSAFWKELGWIRLRPVFIKFLGGVLSIGGGQSLGCEGEILILQHLMDPGN